MSTHPASDASLPLPPCRHIRINLGDPAIVKHTLDEQAAMVSGSDDNGKRESDGAADRMRTHACGHLALSTLRAD